MYGTIVSYLVLIVSAFLSSSNSYGSMALSDSSPVVRAASTTYNPCADIRNGQFVCQDCATLAFCIQQGGEWMTFQYDTCRTDKSMFCDENAKGCTVQRECRTPSRGVKFECQNPGIYPDPYDCQSYHICSSLNEDSRKTCPSGRAFSVADKACTLTAGNTGVCKDKKYTCDQYGAMGAWPGDANIYYKCHVKLVGSELVYYPLLYRCQAGQIFDGQDCISVDGTDSISGSSPTTKTNVSESNRDDAVCMTDGEFLPNANDCKAYYICTKGTKVAYECPKGTVYNSNRRYCTVGKC